MSEALAEGVASGDAADAAPVDDALVVDAPATPETPAAQNLDPSEIRAELEYLRSQNDQFAQAFNVLIERGQTAGEAAQGAAQQTGVNPADLVDEFGNLNPTALVSLIQSQNKENLAQLDQRIQTLTQPFTESQRQANIAEGEKQMRDVIADLSSREGELRVTKVATDRIIEDVRNRYYPEISQRFGEGQRSAEMALERAYRAEADYQKQIADAAIEQHVNRNTSLVAKQGEPGLGGGSAAQTSPVTPLTQRELVLKYAASADRIRTGS